MRYLWERWWLMYPSWQGPLERIFSRDLGQVILLEAIGPFQNKHDAFLVVRSVRLDISQHIIHHLFASNLLPFNASQQDQE